MTVDSTPEAFDKDAYESKLAILLGVSASNIITLLQAASVKVTSYVKVPTQADANAAASTLGALDPAVASTTFNVTVEALQPALVAAWVDMVEPTQASGIDAGAGASLGVLIIAIIQASVIGLVIGPPIIFAGTAVPKALLVVQSFLQFGYTELFDSIMGGDIWALGNIFQSTYNLALGTLALVLASLANEDVSTVNKSLLTGRLLIMPLLGVFATTMFKRFAECEAFGGPTEEFPFGEPLGCMDRTTDEYILALYLFHGAKWLLLAVIAYIGSKHAQEVLILSSALSGSVLFTTSMVQFLFMYLRLYDAENFGTIGPLIVSYTTIFTYAMTGVGVMSQLLIRRYTGQVRKLEGTKKKIQTQIAFEKDISEMVKQAPDEEMKKELAQLAAKVQGYTEGLVAQDELDISCLNPMTNFERFFKARAIKASLGSNAEEKCPQIASRIFTFKYNRIDPNDEKSPKVNCRAIWKMRVQMPRDPDSKKKYKCDDDGCLSIRDYHELLASNYNKGVEEFPGGDLLFRNRMMPIIWPSCIKFNWPRSDYETVPNSKFNLGKCSFKPPIPGFHIFVGGPKIRNALIMNYIAMLWMVPLTRLNVGIMELQYSLRPTSVIVKSYLYRNSVVYRTYRQATIKVQKTMAKIEVAQSAVSSTMDSAETAMSVASDVKDGKTSVKAIAKNQVVPMDGDQPAAP